MEYQLRLSEPIADLTCVREAVCALDPSAVMDTGADGLTLRINAVLAPLDLAWSLRRAGVPASVDQLQAQPSVCCGGCSG
jgi:hypothetical protein